MTNRSKNWLRFSFFLYKTDRGQCDQRNQTSYQCTRCRDPPIKIPQIPTKKSPDSTKQNPQQSIWFEVKWRVLCGGVCRFRDEPTDTALGRGAATRGRVHNARPNLPDGQWPIQYSHIDNPILYGAQRHPAQTQEGAGVFGPHRPIHALHAIVQFAGQHEPYRTPIPYRPLQAAGFGRVEIKIKNNSNVENKKEKWILWILFFFLLLTSRKFLIFNFFASLSCL